MSYSGLKTRKSLTPMTDALVEFVHEFSALETGGTSSSSGSSGSLGRSGKKVHIIPNHQTDVNYICVL